MKVIVFRLWILLGIVILVGFGMNMNVEGLQMITGDISKCLGQTLPTNGMAILPSPAWCKPNGNCDFREVTNDTNWNTNNDIPPCYTTIDADKKYYGAINKSNPSKTLRFYCADPNTYLAAYEDPTLCPANLTHQTDGTCKLPIPTTIHKKKK